MLCYFHSHWGNPWSLWDVLVGLKRYKSACVLYLLYIKVSIIYKYILKYIVLHTYIYIYKKKPSATRSVYLHTYIKPLVFLPGRQVQYVLNSLAQHAACRSPRGLSCLSMRRVVTLTSLFLTLTLLGLAHKCAVTGKRRITDLPLHPKSSVNRFICNC